MTKDQACQAPDLTPEHLSLGRMTMIVASRRGVQPPIRLTAEAESAMQRAAMLSGFGLSRPSTLAS